MRPMEKPVLNKINPGGIFWGAGARESLDSAPRRAQAKFFCGEDKLPIPQKNFWSLDFPRQNKNFQTTS